MAAPYFFSPSAAGDGGGGDGGGDDAAVRGRGLGGRPAPLGLQRQPRRTFVSIHNPDETNIFSIHNPRFVTQYKF
eukprot:3401787-Prymnesium_polylepis.2